MALARQGNERYIPGTGFVEVNPRPKKMLITGHKGMIGRNLWDVVRADDTVVGSGFDLPANNIVSLDETLYHTEQMDTVVHLVVDDGTGKMMFDPFAAYRVNMGGTMNVIRSCIEHKVDRLIFASDLWVEKSDTIVQAAKMAGESYLKAFRNSHGLQSISLRFSNVYGKHSMHKNDAITNMIKSAILSGVIQRPKNGNDALDFLYAEDAADAIMLAHEKTDEKLPSCLDIAGGSLTTLNEVVDIIEEIHGSQLVAETTCIPSHYREAIDTDRADGFLGFRAKTSIEEGIRETYDWMKKEIEQIERLHRV